MQSAIGAASPDARPERVSEATHNERHCSSVRRATVICDSRSKKKSRQVTAYELSVI